jgi:hypothetical protein
MVLDRPSPRSLAWAGLLGLAMMLTALSTVRWLARDGAAGGAAASAPSAAEMAELEGEYRGQGMVLHLRFAEGVLWARSSDARWEPLAVRGAHRLRATTLGYEIDTSALDVAAPSPRVLRLAIGGRTLELARAVWPLIAGVPVAPYLRGTMNDWQAMEPLSGSGPGRYSATIELAGGSHEFKIGSQDWTAIDFGGHRPLRPDGAPLPLLRAGPNIGLLIAESGRYRFDFHLRDAHAPQVSVTRER